MAEADTAHTCPYCRTRAIETVATLPRVRGNGIRAAFTAVTITGCRGCVRIQLLRETLRSGAQGWASPVAALANPVLLTYGVARAGLVRKDLARVARMLAAAGLSGGTEDIEPVRVAYGLAAAMITADGKVAQEEIAAASAIGRRIFPDFREPDFIRVVSSSRDLPSPADLAHVMNMIVGAETRRQVYRYLLAIAAADREIAPEEQGMLAAVAENLGLSDPGSGVDQSV